MLRTHEHFVTCILKIFHGNRVSPINGCPQCCLVHHVLQICTREARCSSCQDLNIHILTQDLPQVEVQDLLAAYVVRGWHLQNSTY